MSNLLRKKRIYRFKFLKSLVSILDSKIGSSIDFVLDSQSFDMNNEIKLHYFHCSLDTFKK